VDFRKQLLVLRGWGEKQRNKRSDRGLESGGEREKNIFRGGVSPTEEERKLQVVGGG